MPRINVEVPNSVVETVDELQELSPSSSRTALVIAALRMLHWALRQRARGRKIIAIDELRDIEGENEFSDAVPVDSTRFAMLR